MATNVQLFEKEIAQMSLTFFTKSVDFQDLRGKHDAWSLTYEQFLALSNVFPILDEEDYKLATKIRQFNTEAMKANSKTKPKPQTFESFKREQNNHPARKSVVLDENGLAAFLFVDMDVQGKAVTKVYWKISILPYKKCEDKKTGEDAIFPLSQKSVANGVSRILTGTFMRALRHKFSTIKRQIDQHGLRDGMQSETGRTVRKVTPILIRTKNATTGEDLTNKQLLACVYKPLKAFIADPDTLLQVFIFKKPQRSVQHRLYDEATKAEAKAKAEAEAEAKAKAEADAIFDQVQNTAATEENIALLNKAKTSAKQFISDEADVDDDDDDKSDVTVMNGSDDEDGDDATESDIDFIDDDSDDNAKDAPIHQHRSADVDAAKKTDSTAPSTSSMRGHGNAAKRHSDVLLKLGDSQSYTAKDMSMADYAYHMGSSPTPSKRRMRMYSEILARDSADKKNDAAAAAAIADVITPPRSRSTSPSILADADSKEKKGVTRKAVPPTSLNVVLDSPPRSPSPPATYFDQSQKRHIH